ncbi:MAG: NADPH-dependent F420 reductase [Candidatus Nanopelagicales bacterium]
MRIAVLGTGTVGATLAGRLLELGHNVTMGSRSATGAAALEWLSQVDAQSPGEASIGTFAEAAENGELIINATAGVASLEVLRSVGVDGLAGKVLIDVSNPLDFSHGFPPELSICNTESLAEQIQSAFTKSHVVKALNTVAAGVMVHPEVVPGDHVLFIAGNDQNAKTTTVALLGEFGWPADRIKDLGDISAARGTEMYLPLWLRLMGSLGTANFNVSVNVE